MGANNVLCETFWAVFLEPHFECGAGLGWAGLAGLAGAGWGWVWLGLWAGACDGKVVFKPTINGASDSQQQQAISIYFFLEGLGFRVKGLGFRL